MNIKSILNFKYICIVVLICSLLSCKSRDSSKLKENPDMTIQKEEFGKTEDDIQIDKYILDNSNGIQAELINYGAILVSLKVLDKNGNSEDITLGFDNLDGYLGDDPYFGATVGRYANRIARGKFILNGKEYTLATNNGENHLHGGNKGFNDVVWSAKEVKGDNSVGVKFHYLSKDGEEGYPGNLSVDVIYTLTEKNELKISYEAETDKPTIVNLTHHSYFNLTGAGNGDILSHKLMINADKYLPVDKGLIPTGKLKSVKGTPMDFTEPMQIGARINKVKGGYDHCFVLNGKKGKLKLAAKIYEPKTGRVMEVHTTEPGLQFYSGNFLDGSITGKNSHIYYEHYGFCLEPQHFPDSPNHPEFFSVILNPSEKYHQLTVYKFYTKK